MSGGFLPQVCRLALVGSVSSEALSANLSGSGGRPCTAFTHSSGEAFSHNLAIAPCAGSWHRA